MVKFEYDEMVRKAVLGIGYDSFVVYLSAVDPKGLSYKTCKVSVRINKQSPDFAEGVHVGESEMEVGSGDQGILFGYAVDETETPRH
jgi:S-adenosylmethionine synthetase